MSALFMTQFEWEVAEALAHDPTRHTDGPTGDVFVNVGQIAPRVAAAIAAAVRADDWLHGGSQQAALAALRGTPT